MDFIFMLTHNDLTVENCVDIFDEIADLGIAHIGFKDIGVRPEMLDRLNRRIKATGATSYLEVVSLSTADAERAARRAREIGVDCLLGGTDMAAMREAVSGTEIRCFPFVGRPEGHPTKLRGDGARIAEDCRRSDALGCAGIDLLAYRAIDSDPLDLVREARAALKGQLIVAGSIDSPSRIAALAEAGVDAFTLGSAAFDRAFVRGEPSVRGQIVAVLAACR
ncbi:MAG TPA: hypothetical protein VHT04_16080 [Stellaceae bacterium]|jgi:hypothetical protein|nr:hypothetical protein [Stellaceae bacterium]